MLKVCTPAFVACVFLTTRDYSAKYLILEYTGGKKIAWAGESCLTDR